MNKEELVEKIKILKEEINLLGPRYRLNKKDSIKYTSLQKQLVNCGEKLRKILIDERVSDEQCLALGKLIIDHLKSNNGSTWTLGMLCIKVPEVYSSLEDVIWAFEDPGCGCCSGGDIISSASTLEELIKQ